ncbi:unnamed protein product [Candida verbasci]|uniref:Carboxylic ester hydrolase n=1 Tax=Candida verbasci TaxID=1227364 RepID=A0A9W4TZK4_9ASCO|nr:unnamed protein product [Candida verbasci]
MIYNFILLATSIAAASIPAGFSFCSSDGIKDALPDVLGVQFDQNSISASIANATVGIPYCNVSLSYSHPGKNDIINLKYAFPSTTSFKNRYYSAGGGGYTLNQDPTGGLKYGAGSGATDAGYDAFHYSFDEQVLFGNGSINWDGIYMFGYQALGELTKIGKGITKNLYSMNDDKLYTYFEGCSDGGREGMSQAQVYGEEYDGIVSGAPAFRYAQQQVIHLFPAQVEKTLGYNPPPCELAKIVNATIDACDKLDGRVDGVISRSDLCMLQFDLDLIIGEPYYCAAQTSTSLGFGFGKRNEGSTTQITPEQNGTVSKEGVAVAKAINNGLFNSKGQRGYLSWQIGSSFSDAETTYNHTTDSWNYPIISLGGTFVAKFVELLNIDNITELPDSYEVLIDWMDIAYNRYLDSLQTTNPDLTKFQSHGGKLLHYHGENDPSVPAASSVHYWQSVRDIMYGNYTWDESLEQLNEWYQFYLIPGASHCAANDLQPGPYPKSNVEIIINWVENGIKPSGLNTVTTSGPFSGEEQNLCMWPDRPYWTSHNNFTCEFDQASYDSWTYTFDAFKVPIY